MNKNIYIYICHSCFTLILTGFRERNPVDCLGVTISSSSVIVINLGVFRIGADCITLTPKKHLSRADNIANGKNTSEYYCPILCNSWECNDHSSIPYKLHIYTRCVYECVVIGSNWISNDGIFTAFTISVPHSNIRQLYW